MSLDYQETGKFIGVIIFLIWMFLITHRSGQIILNPMFIVFGWQLKEVTFSYPGSGNTHTGRVLLKGEVSKNSSLEVISIQNIMVARAPANPSGELNG